MNENIPKLSSRRSTEEEVFLLQKAREEFFRNLERIEEAAKYVIGAVGAVAGLFLAGLQVKLAVNPKLTQTPLEVPFLLWGISLILAILVFLPFPYRSVHRSPKHIHRVFSRARWIKWSLLLLSVLLLAGGIFCVAWYF